MPFDSDMDHSTWLGNDEPRCPRCHAERDACECPPSGGTGRELSADEMTRAAFEALAKVSAKTKGAA